MILFMLALALSQPDRPRFHVERLAPSVYALVRDEPIGFAQNANSLIVVGDRDVTVVDAQFTREATFETLAAIRRITTKRVGAVITTHWHDDHFAGTQVYRDTFPSVRLIQQANTVEDLAALGRPNRAGQLAGAPPAADRFERLLASGLGGDSTPASADERAALTAAIRIVRTYVAEAPGFREIAASDTVRDHLELGSGRERIEVRWFGCGNTRGDLVVFVPAAGVVATGDLVVWPVPFGFGSYPAEWAADLDSILARAPRVVVPGHGPVLRNLDYVRTERAMLGRLLGGASTLDSFRLAVPLDPKWRDFLFDQFFLQPLVRAVAAGRRCGA